MCRFWGNGFAATNELDGSEQTQSQAGFVPPFFHGIRKRVYAELRRLLLCCFFASALSWGLSIPRVGGVLVAAPAGGGVRGLVPSRRTRFPHGVPFCSL